MFQKVLQRVEIQSILLYQYTLSPFLKYLFKGGCRFEPKCSDYSLAAIKKYGPYRGFYLALVRFLRCNPLSRHPKLYPLE